MKGLSQTGVVERDPAVVLGVQLLLALAEVVDGQLGVLDADAGERRDGGGDERVAADGRALADDRLAAEDGGAGVDRDVVLDGRVALFAGELETRAGGQRGVTP